MIKHQLDAVMMLECYSSTYGRLKVMGNVRRIDPLGYGGYDTFGIMEYE